MTDTTTRTATGPTTGIITEQDRVRLAPGVMLRHDRARDQWTLLAPERVLVLDEVALDVVRACTADAASVGTAIDRLAAQFEAPRAEIAADVLDLLHTLRDRGFITS
ncbi:pyrroloquinoline quinone biosynthesis peptide chaperone PqqD [Azospirillum sp.]|uniref:pyrroloquinoline quinone biosynthesis peptide chaperone PqqD n=1 Tax=Azospirillum sp. TaxID=34012 RepID=UPI002D5B5CBD|nr:pyrroloquinoline quinone biosynthesis peptide chaperone PqqD [Azospirillum sp.]HYD65609.1 pyrroloquinoline quinone biosynthesis peptide chaperone PqqD [Azospirillum sp.]